MDGVKRGYGGVGADMAAVSGGEGRTLIDGCESGRSSVRARREARL